MRTYHPESWSYQAREMCDRQIASINTGWQTIIGASEFFSSSYRHFMITTRAAKRFGRAVRMGNVHENITLYNKHYPEV